MNRPATIFAGGDPVPSSALPAPAPGTLVVAADSGLDTARRLRVPVDLVVGDLDSADPAAVAAAEAQGAMVERHPVDKDATDLELALEAVLARDRSPVVVLGGAGWDRLDHFLANALLLARPRFAGLGLRWLVKGAEVMPVHDRAEIFGEPGDVVSLLAVGGAASGVTTTGLRWPLADEVLLPGSTRGVSNRLIGRFATVTLANGTLLALHLGRIT